jgi:hypothetical protein
MEKVSYRQRAEECAEWFHEIAEGAIKNPPQSILPAVVTFHYGQSSLKFPGVSYTHSDQKMFYLYGNEIYERLAALLGMDEIISEVWFIFSGPYYLASYLPQATYDEMRDPAILALHRFGANLVLHASRFEPLEERIEVEMEVEFFPSVEDIPL